MKVLPLIGYRSIKALHAFGALLLGLQMLPAHRGKGFETFYEEFGERNDEEKETLLREAAFFVQLEQEEIEAIISFVADKNGIPYQPANLKNLSPKEIHEIIVAVCMEIGRIKIDLVTPEEKKNSDTSLSI